MTRRARWVAVIAVAALALGGVAAVGVLAWQRAAARNVDVDVAVAPDAGWAEGDRIVFRSTAPGGGYGIVASVPLSDPTGPRALSGRPCDRVDAGPRGFACLSIERGIVPGYVARLYADDGRMLQEWPLPGIPSRTRLSDDGTLVATTAFVTGHSYAGTAFSTQTVVRETDGDELGDLEDFSLVIDGTATAPLDRNLWGVTFADDTTFYATAATGGRTHLVRGDLAQRTLTSIAEGVECPSLSPDGTRIAFKRTTAGSGPTAHWTPAILELATGEVVVLPEERSVDDQIEWLDDGTILYGLPRAAGDSDVWSLASDGSRSPVLFLEHAWSPSVVRTP